MKLVSCLCPSKRSLAHLQRTIDNFLAQTYPCKELIVLRTEGIWREGVRADEIFGIQLPCEHRVRFYVVPPGLSIGELRNVAARLSRGSVFAHVDDDDVSHPERLAKSMAAIDNGASLVGSSRVIFEEPKTRMFTTPPADEAEAENRRGYLRVRGNPPEAIPELEKWGTPARYLFDGAALTPKYLVGGTLVYRRELWERRNFEDVQQGEDSRAFWGWLKDMKQMDGEQWPGLQVADLADEQLYTATLSPDATSPKLTDSPGWSVIE